MRQLEALKILDEFWERTWFWDPYRKELPFGDTTKCYIFDDLINSVTDDETS